MDLQQHEMQVHGEALSHTTKRAMKEARRLQVDINYDHAPSSSSAAAESSHSANEAERRARARQLFAARDDAPAASSSSADTGAPRAVPGLPPQAASSSRGGRSGRAGFSGQLSSDEEAKRQKKDAEQRACVAIFAFVVQYA